MKKKSSSSSQSYSTPKKSQSNSPKKSNSKSSKHPVYQQMVTEALQTLNSRNGSSRAKILIHLKNTYGIEGGKIANSHLRSALEALLEDSVITLAKGTGYNNGYYRIASKGKKSNKKGSPSPKKVDHDQKVNKVVKKILKHHKVNLDHQVKVNHLVVNQLQKVNLDHQVKVNQLVVNHHHHKNDHDHQVNKNQLVVNQHLQNDHDHQVKTRNKLVKKLLNHHENNPVHLVKINLVVVVEKKLKLNDQLLVHQVNHKILQIKPKVKSKIRIINNHNNVDDLKVVKNDKMMINKNQDLIIMMVLHHQQKKLESLVVVIAKRQANDRKE